MKSEINATIAKYEKENAMWRCTINRKTSPLISIFSISILSDSKIALTISVRAICAKKVSVFIFGQA